MRRQFKETIGPIAAADDRLVLLLGDISVYMFQPFQQAHPDRFYNLGILENTLISTAAGLAARGFIPVVHTIAPFLTERSIEQIKLDLAYNQFAANIVTCGATFDYAWDGPTHHAYLDMAALRLIPGVEVIQPGSRKELDTLFRAHWANGRTTYFRLSDHPHNLDLSIEPGRGIVLREGKSDLVIMTAGPLLGDVMAGCDGSEVTVVYFHTIKPIDHALIERYRDHRILVVHDGHGLHEAINEVPGLWTAYHGLPDQFIGYYGTVHDIRRVLGLDATGIRARVASLLGDDSKAR
jgi:transketolase